MVLFYRKTLDFVKFFLFPFSRSNFPLLSKILFLQNKKRGSFFLFVHPPFRVKGPAHFLVIFYRKPYPSFLYLHSSVLYAML